MLRCPVESAASSISRTTTSRPARAVTSAIPDPMSPHPTTPTRSILIPTSASAREPALSVEKSTLTKGSSGFLGALVDALAEALDGGADALSRAQVDGRRAGVADAAGCARADHVAGLERD